jgi:hypothetical protein
MKLRLILILLASCFVNSVYSQDTISKKFELGSVLITRRYSSLIYGIPDAPLNNFFSGVFFRYHKNKWALRAEIDYSESYTKTPNNILCIDCYSGNSNNKVFELAVGAQYKFTKKKSFLYTYSDIYFRNINSKGFVSGGIQGLNDSFKLRAAGIGGDLGIGASLLLFKKIRISPEFGYDIAVSQNKITRMVLVTGELSEERNGLINATMKSKLLLTIPF